MTYLKNNMRIALEARSLSTLGGGVRTYTKALISRILKSNFPADFSVYYDSVKHLSTFQDADEKVVPVYHPFLRLAWDYFFLPNRLRADRVDFVHYFKPATTPFAKPRSIATVYDVIPLLYPDTQTRIQRAYWNKQLPLVAQTCEHILTISECSKKDIVEKLQVDPGKVTVTYLGVDSRFCPVPEEEKQEIKKKLHLPEKFILYLGTIEPRKNVATLIRSFDQAAKSCEHSLVIAGKWGWGFDNVKEALVKAKNRNRIILLDYVDNALLPALYSAADFFVFPSIYEGFGLPVLEALACGTPVITTNVSSLVEVGGGVALTVNPYDEKELAGAITKLANDRELKHKQSVEGVTWAKRFTWEKTTDETLAVYRKVFVK